MWITPQFLYNIKSIGASAEVMNPHISARAIHTRVILRSGIDIGDIVTQYFLAANTWKRLRAGQSSTFDSWMEATVGHTLQRCITFSESCHPKLKSANPHSRGRSPPTAHSLACQTNIHEPGLHLHFHSTQSEAMELPHQPESNSQQGIQKL